MQNAERKAAVVFFTWWGIRIFFIFPSGICSKDDSKAQLEFKHAGKDVTVSF